MKGTKRGEIASERLRSNGEFVFGRPRQNRELAAEGFDGAASESLDGAARGRGASS